LSEEHSGNLALDVQLEALAEFYHQGPGVCVSGVQGQDQETVQVIVHHLVSLIVRGPFQSIDSIRFCVDQKELTSELLFEVGPESNGKDASVRFLVKEVLGPPHGLSIFEEGKGPEDFLLVTAELLQGQAQIEGVRVEEGLTGTSFTGEVWGRGKFWPCLLFRWSSQDWGRRADRRGRCGYRRWSDGQSGSRASYELSELL